MAEAIGLAAGVAGLLDIGCRVSKSLYKLQKEFKNAPHLIQALANEVEDIRAVLGRYEDAVQATELSGLGTPSSAAILGDLEVQLNKAKTILNDLDIFVQEIAAETPRRQKARWYREKSRALELQSSLREVRARVNELLAAHTSSTSTKIQLELRSVRLGVAQNHLAVDQLLGSHSQAIGNQISSLQREVDRGHVDTVAMFQSIQEILSQLPQSVSNQLPSFQDNSQQRTPLDPIQPAPTSLETLANNTKTDFNLRPDMSLFNAAFLITLGLRGSRCGSGCLCVCHSPSRSRFSCRLPRALDRVLGSLFLGYAGVPTSAASCNLESCSKTRYLRLTVTYCFPTWFLNRALQTFVEVSTSSFKFALVPLRRVKYEAAQDNILFQVNRGGPSSVQNLLRKDSSLVLEVDHQYGLSVLSLALSGQQSWSDKIAIIQALLLAGADPDQEDDYTSCMRHQAARLIVTRQVPDEVCTALGQLLPITSCIDDLELTLVHKIVTGYCPLDLQTALQSRSPELLAQVNARDRFGFTPMMHAARNHKLESFRALLHAGADVHAVTADGYSALHLVGKTEAATPACTEIINLLLAAGADVNAAARDGVTALHYAAYNNCVAAIDALLAGGADIEYQTDRNKSTPLTYAAQCNHAQAVRLLIKHGADINATNNEGSSLLSLAIETNSHDAQAVLLENGADYLWSELRGGILHQAAYCADEKTYKTLAGFKLKGVDVNLANTDGKTATQVFEERQGTSSDLRLAFDELLQSLEPVQPQDNTGTDWSDSDEEFVDALE